MEYIVDEECVGQRIDKVLSDLNSEQRKIILEFLRIIMKVSDVRNANITF